MIIQNICLFLPSMLICQGSMLLTRWLKQQKLFSHYSKGYKSKIDVSARLVSSERPLSSVCRWLSPFWVLTWSSLCHLCVPISSCKDTSHSGLGPALKTSFKPITSLEALCPSRVTFCFWEQRFQQRNLGGTLFSP